MTFITRIAPSPTGDMHFGTARTAYFSWLAARASDGKFILRIDDSDAKRSTPAYTNVILETMAWLKLNYDEIHYQSQRFGRYRKLAQTLLELGYAKTESNGAVSFTLSGLGGVCSDLRPGIIDSSWHDEVVGDVKITANDIKYIEGMILIKGDGSPSYNWATVVDDSDFGINYIIRGHEHITNTSKQIALYKALGAVAPKFAHVGLIFMEKKKLSKRDNAASMLWYKEQGYDPDALLNTMARLGWGPTIDDKSTALLPRDKMVELFLKGGKMKSSSANLDMAKLNSFDRKYKAIKEKESSKL